MDKLNITDIAQMISAIAILFGLIAGFVAWLTSMYSKVSNIYSVLNQIQSEFAPNGGCSLRDAINSISANQTNILSARHTLHTYIDRTCDTPMIIADRSGRCAWANKAFLQLTNRNLSDVLDNLWETTVHVDDRDFVREEWYNACEDGRQLEIAFRLSVNGMASNYVKCNVYGDTHCGYVAFLEKIDAGELEALKKIAVERITN